MKIGRGEFFESSAVNRLRGTARSNPFQRGRTALRRVTLAACLVTLTPVIWSVSRDPASLAPGAAVDTVPAGLAAAATPPASGFIGGPAAPRGDQHGRVFTGYRPGQLMLEIHALQALHDLKASHADCLERAEFIWQELLAAGAAAVPDALDFLRTGEDLTVGGRAGTEFDFETLRLALIDALRRIGGADVERALFEQLQTTASITELEALAVALDELQPGFYRDAILETSLAFLEALSTASGSIPPLETAPLFRVIQDFGDEGIVPLLQDVPDWYNAYAAVVLSNLPGGQGIDFLSAAARRALRTERDNRALFLIAQAATREERAEKALQDLILANEIPEESWPIIADILIGDRQLQLHEPPTDPMRIGSLRGSNPFAVQTIVDRQVQVVYGVNYSAVLSAEEAAARLDLIDRLLESAMSPVARAWLWSARNLLEANY